MSRAQEMIKLETEGTVRGQPLPSVNSCQEGLPCPSLLLRTVPSARVRRIGESPSEYFSISGLVESKIDAVAFGASAAYKSAQ